MIVPLLEEVSKHSRKLLRNMANDSSIFEETDYEFIIVFVALLPFEGYYLSNKRLPDLLGALPC